MSLKNLLTIGVGVALSVSVAANVMAAQDASDPSFKGTVNMQVIDNNTDNYQNRVSTDLVERPAPQVGQTRAAIEAMYGTPWPALAPNKNGEVYTNEYDFTDGKRYLRKLSGEALRVYEITYNRGARPSANDKAVDVKLRVIPRLGDHKNMVSKLLGSPSSTFTDQEGQHAIYSIPRHRFVFYNDVITSPYEAVNMYFGDDGFLVGQEFLPGRNHGFYSMTSAGRFVPWNNGKAQPDRKFGW